MSDVQEKTRKFLNLMLKESEEQKAKTFLNLLIHDFRFGDMEIKRAGGGDLLVTGHGSVFNNVDGHNDIVEPGAFKETIAQHQEDDTAPRMYVNHQSGEAGTWYHFEEDSKGLAMSGVISASKPQGRKAIELHNSNKLAGLSIGYRVIRQDKSTPGIRRLQKVHLAEVSLVSSEYRPSNPLAKLTPAESKRTGALMPAAGHEYR